VTFRPLPVGIFCLLIAEKDEGHLQIKRVALAIFQVYQFAATLILAPIDSALEELAGFERQDVSGRNFYCIACLWVSSTARRFALDNKIAESGNLDLFPILQGRLHQFEYPFDDIAGLFFGKSGFQVNFFDQVNFGHAHFPPPAFCMLLFLRRFISQDSGLSNRIY
jgi:hypothetical protein